MPNEETKQPDKPDFAMTEIAQALYLLVKTCGGVVTISRGKLKGPHGKLFIDYVDKLDAYRLTADVKPQQIIQHNRKLIVPGKS